MIGLRFALVAATIVTLTGGGPALAHHSYSVYDSERVVTLNGVIREVKFEHPHVEAMLDVEGKIWRLDLPSPSRAVARGLTQDLLRVGKTVSVQGWPHRGGALELAPVEVTIEGTTIRLRR